MKCQDLYIHTDRTENTEEKPIRECLYRANAWEKLTPSRSCPDDDHSCPYTENGHPPEDDSNNCSH